MIKLKLKCFVFVMWCCVFSLLIVAIVVLSAYLHFRKFGNTRCLLVFKLKLSNLIMLFLFLFFLGNMYKSHFSGFSPND